MSVTVPTKPPVVMTRAEIAQWLIDLCHFYGADLVTGLKVAAAFIADVEDTPEGAQIKLGRS